jgi:hypothetical protein
VRRPVLLAVHTAAAEYQVVSFLPLNASLSRLGVAAEGYDWWERPKLAARSDENMQKRAHVASEAWIAIPHVVHEQHCYVWLVARCSSRGGSKKQECTLHPAYIRVPR